MKPVLKPTEAEHSILKVLWARGPSTVREIQEVLQTHRPTGYTTVLKLLQIMTEKGLVDRDERLRSHIYHPCFTEVQTQELLLRELTQRAFGGSAAKLVMQALSTKKTTPEELAIIRKLVDRLEETE